MLALRDQLLALLGSSFTVTHNGPAGPVTVTVNVGDFGTAGTELALPCVLFLGESATSRTVNIGSHGNENASRVEAHILTVDGPQWNGPLLAKDVYAHIESVVRANELTTGSSFFTIASAYRDFPPRVQMATQFWYTRWVEFRGTSLETY